MAHPPNRSIDFAPSWLKLPEQTQIRKSDNSYNNSNGSNHPVHPRHSNPLSVNTNSISSSGSLSTPPYHSQNLGIGHQQSNSTNIYHSSSHIASAQPHSPAGSGHTHHYRPGRPQLNSYNSYHSRSSPSGPVTQQNAPHVQRSQSTGSYNDILARSQAGTSTAGTVNPPLEEDFPVLRSGPSAAAPHSNHATKTAQWRIQARAKNDSVKSATNSQADNLLTSKMSGKNVYRAQVKPVKRSNVIPITNGSTASTSSSVTASTIPGRENDGLNSPTGPSTLSNLSSSLDKEKKFLQELGWKENEESDEDVGIPEQDPAQLQYIMQEAKAARQRLLKNCKQSMKSVPTAVLPNEDDIISSSSDNSDME